MKYKAYQITETGGKFSADIVMLDSQNLPDNEVLIRVKYSSLNYKDALSVTGNKGVTKKYPHTPGIDAAGVVEVSHSDLFQTGDEVIVTGNDLGMNTPGGFGELISVPAEWIVKLPEGLTLKESMIIGTAGFTAAISVLKIISSLKPQDGNIVVTGATGGVGSMSLAMLSKLGYNTVAISGKENDSDFLKNLGVKEIISRNDFLSVEDKPLLPAQFAGAIDTVGGEILVKILKSVKQYGIVTTCGSVSSVSLENLNVFPFILRGITLHGISAQNYPIEQRKTLWQKLANELKPEVMLNIYREINSNDLTENIRLILNGQIKGRTVLKH